MLYFLLLCAVLIVAGCRGADGNVKEELRRGEMLDKT